jgi:uncharacterized protein
MEKNCEKGGECGLQGGCVCGRGMGGCHRPSPAKRAAALALLMLAVWLGFKTRNVMKEHDYIGVPLQSYSISVSGEGKVVGVPDVATVDLGMVVERSRVAEAQAENTKTMNALIAALEAMGVEKKDIQTTSYNVLPMYDWNDGRQRLRGYSVSQNVHVKVRKLDTVGDVLGKAGELGANQIGGVNFTVDEPESLQQEAREKALENAKDKASALAEVAGVKLGRVINFQESFGGAPIPIYYAKDLGIGGAAASESAPRVEAGSTEVTANVTITYQLE